MYEVRVVAKDTPSNPPGDGSDAARISDPIIVDNTPPECTSQRASPRGKTVTVHAELTDAGTPIAEASLRRGQR